MNFRLSLFLILAGLALSGCYSAMPANEAGNSANTSENAAPMPVNTNQTEPVNLAANVPAANKAANSEIQPTQYADTPEGTLKALADAGNKGDLTAVKQLFNRKSLDMTAAAAKAQKKSIDEVLVKQRTITLLKGISELRNQVIEGNSATIEIRLSKNSNWEKIYFTREDGHWKIAEDKYVEEMVRQVEESTKDLEKDDKEK